MRNDSYMRIMGVTPQKEEETSVILGFTYDKKNNLSAFHKGMIAFVSRNYEGTVKSGEVWICNLERSDRCWYAIPLRIVDDQFYMGLTHGQIGEMARHLWDTDREMIMPYIHEAVAEEYETRIGTITRERDANAETLASAEEEIADLRSRNEELRKRLDVQAAEQDAENRNVCLISELEERNRVLNIRLENIIKQMEMMKACGSEMRCEVTANLKRFPDDAIVFAGPNELYSRSFEDGNYDVRIDVLGTRISIRKNIDGLAVSNNGTIVLDGLDRMTEFTEKRELRTVRDDDGTMTCTIRGTVETV